LPESLVLKYETIDNQPIAIYKKANRLIMSMFHNILGVPREKMERLPRWRLVFEPTGN